MLLLIVLAFPKKEKAVLIFRRMVVNIVRSLKDIELILK